MMQINGFHLPHAKIIHIYFVFLGLFCFCGFGVDVDCVRCVSLVSFVVCAAGRGFRHGTGKTNDRMQADGSDRKES